jgi:hypothetical protein
MREWLGQTRRSGASNAFGAALHLEFAEDIAMMPFDQAQGDEKPCPDLAIRESAGNELEHFQFAL